MNKRNFFKQITGAAIGAATFGLLAREGGASENEDLNKLLDDSGDVIEWGIACRQYEMYSQVLHSINNGSPWPPASHKPWAENGMGLAEKQIQSLLRERLGLIYRHKNGFIEKVPIGFSQ